MLKTCGLIKAACVLGCLSNDECDENKILSAIEYAENLGIAFQIQDDILDIEGDCKSLGKPVGSDAESKKSTYVSMLGLEKSKAYADELTKKAVEALDVFGDSGDFLRELAVSLINRRS